MRRTHLREDTILRTLSAALKALVVKVAALLQAPDPDDAVVSKDSQTLYMRFPDLGGYQTVTDQVQRVLAQLAGYEGLMLSPYGGLEVWFDAQQVPVTEYTDAPNYEVDADTDQGDELDPDMIMYGD